MAAKAVVKTALSQADGGATAGPIPLGARIGRVVALDENAAPWVDFSGNTNAPVRALLAPPVAHGMRLASAWREARVPTGVSDQDLRRPVITGRRRSWSENTMS